MVKNGDIFINPNGELCFVLDNEIRKVEGYYWSPYYQNPIYSLKLNR